MNEDRKNWNERYRTGEFDPPDTPSPFLCDVVDTLPDGRALDVATGMGRNALFLAECGYEVDAVDVSDEALSVARERADERSLSVDWTRADLDEYAFSERTYDVITISFYRTFDRLPDIKEALAPDGILLYEHHLRTTEPVDRGPESDRYRLRPNDLLHACLDLTILQYEEKMRIDVDGRRAAIVTVMARNSAGGAQQYPNL